MFCFQNLLENKDPDIAFSFKNQLLCMLMGIFTAYFISDVLSAFTLGGGVFA